eukprot:s16_g24.t2
MCPLRVAIRPTEAAESTPAEGASEAVQSQTSLDELQSMGFAPEEAKEALAKSNDDLVEALAFLAQRHKKRRKGNDLEAAGETPKDETLEVEGIQCALTPDDELVMLLPGDAHSTGPVVGRRLGDGSLRFDGMDDWLGELYEGHRPRAMPGCQLPCFDLDAAVAALEDGAPYVWDGFADLSEIRAANVALEEMFQRRSRMNTWELCVDGAPLRRSRSQQGPCAVDDAEEARHVLDGAPHPWKSTLFRFRFWWYGVPPELRAHFASRERLFEPCFLDDWTAYMQLPLRPFLQQDFVSKCLTGCRARGIGEYNAKFLFSDAYVMGNRAAAHGCLYTPVGPTGATAGLGLIVPNWAKFQPRRVLRCRNPGTSTLRGCRPPGNWRQLSRGSGLWVDECTEGGHARNRKALETQKRDDACGFWDIQGGSPAPPGPVLLLFQRLEAAAARFRSAYGWPLLCSRLGMAAVYDGQGACYEQHRDNEWQRHLTSRTPKGLVPKSGSEAKQRRLDFGDVPSGAWMNFRELTMLAYVNLPEDFGDHPQGRQNGGRLRCYVNTKRGDLKGDTARELKDLEPVGGRAVIFRSKELLHEVLPSFGRRYCLTFWVCTPH